MKVRVNSWYIYEATGLDIFSPTSSNKANKGQRVKVVNLPSAPKANMMGQCYIEDADGNFIGMVSTSSLTKAS